MATKKSTQSRKETLWWTVIFILNIAVYTLAFTNPSWLGGI